MRRRMCYNCAVVERFHACDHIIEVKHTGCFIAGMHRKLCHTDVHGVEGNVGV